MNALFHWIAELATRRSKWVLLVIALISVVAAIGASRLVATFHFRVFFDYPGNPRVAELDRYNEEFGDDGGFAVLVVETKDVFTAPVLRYIQEVSSKLKRKPQFRRIMSLSLNAVPRGRHDDVVTGPLFERVPEDPATLRQIREIALSNRLVVPHLVSKDGRYAMVAAEFKRPLAKITAEEAGAGNAAVREVMASTPVPPGVRVVLGGTSISEEEAPKVMVRDQGRLLPTGLALTIVVMLLSLGTFRAVLTSFLEILMTIFWTMGFMGFMGMSINIMSSSTPTILLIYGLVDSVFIIALFQELYETEEGEGRAQVRAAMTKTIRRIGPACLLTSVTTAVGFFSFSSGSLPIVDQYGYALAFGVGIAFLDSIVLMPALVCVLPPPHKRGPRQSPISKAVGAGLAHLVPFTMRFRWQIITVSVIVLAVSTITVLQKSRISTVLLKELPQNMKGIEAINLVADHLTGVFSTGVLISGPPGSMQEPKLLKAMDQLDEWAERNEITVTSLSPSDLVREMHRAFNGGDRRFDRIPDDRGLISQYLALLDPATRADFLTDDGAKTHLRIMCKDIGSYRWRTELFEPLQRKARELLPGYHLEFPGFMRAYDDGSTMTVKQMVVGFWQAFVGIVILLAIFYRSVRLALLSIVPNLLPAMITMAVMALIGTTLRATTVMFLSVVVGMIFDDTIHLFTGMREFRSQGMTHQEALRATLAELGPPIVYTTLLIAAGLGIFMISSIPVLFNLGLATTSVVLMGAVCDLVLTVTLLGLWGESRASRRAREAPPSPEPLPPGQ